MTYDHWKTTPPDDGEEPRPEVDSPEAAWEYWHERAHRAEVQIRDLFAAAALTGLSNILNGKDAPEAARRAYQAADAMLEVRGHAARGDDCKPIGGHDALDILHQ